METDGKSEPPKRGSWTVPPLAAFVTCFFSLLTGVFLAQAVWMMLNERLAAAPVDRQTLSPFCQGVSLSYSVLQYAQLALSGTFAAVFIVLSFFLLLGRGWARLHSLLVWSMALICSLFVPAELSERAFFFLLIGALIFLPLSLKSVRSFYSRQSESGSEKKRGRVFLAFLYGTFLLSQIFILWNNRVLLADPATLPCLETAAGQGLD